jgi:hypothetical protein
LIVNEYAPAPERAWDQLPSEPPSWYSKFLIFRDLGPDRSIRECFLECTRLSGKEKASMSSAWSRRSIEFKWIERALAWDKHLSDRRQRDIERLWNDRGLSIIDNLLSVVDAVSASINMDDVKPRDIPALVDSAVKVSAHCGFGREQTTVNANVRVSATPTNEVIRAYLAENPEASITLSGLASAMAVDGEVDEDATLALSNGDDDDDDGDA